MWSLQITYQVILLPQYLTISSNFLVLLTFFSYFLNEIGPGLIKQSLFLTRYHYNEEHLIKPNNGNVDQTFDGFLTNFKSILDMYATLKRSVSKK